MEGGKEANYWPGFVDALSNVVVTMVFVMVVFVIALLYYSQNKAKEAIENYRQQTEEQLAGAPKPDPDLARKLAEALKENAALKAALDKANAALKAAASSPAAAAAAAAAVQAGATPKAEVKVTEPADSKTPTAATAQIRGSQAAIEIIFPQRAFELDKASQAALEAQFASIAAKARTQGIDMVAIAEEAPYSEGRRLSYYRNMLLRNWLIDHGVPQDKIRMRMTEQSTGRNTGLVQLSVAGGG